MSETSHVHVFLCNGARGPRTQKGKKVTQLEYRTGARSPRNVNISLPNFVHDIVHLPPRILDLLEIAAYVFSGDRAASRGTPDSLEYHSWSRILHFHIRVRDVAFWRGPPVQRALSRALEFMTGDAEYRFTFTGGHKTPPTSLFDDERFCIAQDREVLVALFSGGLDSLAGVLQLLATRDRNLCLASHQSQPSMRKTQERLVEALQLRYPGKVDHYRYRCSFRRKRAVDENQRSRAFLYTSIAYAICQAFGLREFFVFENGVTAMNFPKRQDMMNARASRTTHPKTIRLLTELFSLIGEAQIVIHTPFIWKTKADLLRLLDDVDGRDLITSTISCSRTFQRLGPATHCGTCSQCIDRRLAAYSAKLDEIDHCGLYACDFIGATIEDHQAQTMVVDYVRQARDFATANVDWFYQTRLPQLGDVVEGFPNVDEQRVIEDTFALCQRHGTQILDAIRNMRQREDLYRPLSQGSFLDLVSKREYLKDPVQRLVASICTRLHRALPLAFQTVPPKNEKDLNDKVSAILNGEKPTFEREHPHLSFACGHVVPDHSARESDLYVESKYVRGTTTPSRASEGIAADLTKYAGAYTLFVVYDPTGKIADRERFKADFEERGNCTVHIIS